MGYITAGRILSCLRKGHDTMVEHVAIELLNTINGQLRQDRGCGKGGGVPPLSSTCHTNPLCCTYLSMDITLTEELLGRRPGAGRDIAPLEKQLRWKRPSKPIYKCQEP